jgi:hypothetical protein
VSAPPDALSAAEARLERDHPGYLAQVRAAAAALAVPATPRQQAERALALAERAAAVTANIDVAASRPASRLAKKAVAAVTRFYFMHMSSQVAEFAESSTWAIQALTAYAAALEEELSALRHRVRCLEEGQPDP